MSHRCIADASKEERRDEKRREEERRGEERRRNEKRRKEQFLMITVWGLALGPL